MHLPSFQKSLQGIIKTEKMKNLVQRDALLKNNLILLMMAIAKKVLLWTNFTGILHGEK